MPRNDSQESLSPSDFVTIKSKPSSIKLTGIIILPRAEDEESPTSSSSDTPLPGSSSSSSSPDHCHGAGHTLRRTSTSMSALSVSFATLPHIPPRKRRSAAPLGVASRGAMMRRRRAGMPGYDANGDPLLPPAPPTWTDDDADMHTQRLFADHADHAQRGANNTSLGTESDDPLVTLGRKMKGAGKSFWRKMGQGKKPAPGMVVQGRTETLLPDVISGDRTVVAQIAAFDGSTGEGGVWEEEAGSRYGLNVGQTETVAEGQSPWKQLPPVPTDDTSDGTSSGQERASDEVSSPDQTAASDDSQESAVTPVAGSKFS